jgi:hypothetical protein
MNDFWAWMAIGFFPALGLVIALVIFFTGSMNMGGGGVK